MASSPDLATDKGKPITMDFLREFGTRWEHAWNSHRTDEVLALVDDDILFEDTVFWPEVVRGIDELRRYVDTIWQVMPDVQFSEVQLFAAPDDGRGLYLFRQQGSAPDRFGYGRFDTYGCDIFLEFKDGRLARYLAQYEITEMMRQFGALPPREGRIGGAYLLSLLGRRGNEA
ncbi:nuclear transport factor 2 family protein [Nocardioides marmoriginsengisoli]|uniref:Nuclear transport factor 2 family protein n=1 Tax=Nocardioides marmoriginsengisoli TaxID=661483 RepID=A0A3N0CH22_9ACTN|nr:nuclear transport factor 2 family protein [Nocardioides marmoriginsengisoli]RNL62755.1 nuclear transport factor 2 family protein [Nocardioides marmoriginsengisoli]